MKYYFASILLESNRWNKGEKPILTLNDWIEKIKSKGFEGLELWENHGYMSTDAGLEHLRESFSDILVNFYPGFTNQEAEQRKKVLNLIKKTGACGCKFNFGNDTSRIDEYITNFRLWASWLPENFRIICECHGNTVCEEPEKASDILSALNDSRVEALVHAKNTPGTLKNWFESLGPVITHCHANFFRISGNPWTDDSHVEFDIKESLRMIGRSSVKTISLEFTRGVGEENENMNTLFHNAVEDYENIKKEISL